MTFGDDQDDQDDQDNQDDQDDQDDTNQDVGPCDVAPHRPRPADAGSFGPSIPDDELPF